MTPVVARHGTQPKLHMDIALTVIAIICALTNGFVLGMVFENQSVAVGARILRLLRIIKS